MKQLPIKPTSTAKQTNTTNSERITKQQLYILTYLYRFRFVSTRQLQVLTGKKQIQQIQQRLNRLLAKEYIGRNFSSQDRLMGRYASYYLLPKGMKLLKRSVDNEGRLASGITVELQMLHNIYKDKSASTRFINHCLGVGDIYSQLIRIYGNELKYLSNTQLVGYCYLPEPLPDGFFRLVSEGSEDLEFFLEYCEEIVPFWVYRNRIKYWIEYTDDDIWEDAVDTPMPTILLVAETPVLQRRIQRFLKRQLPDSYTDAVFLVTNKESLTLAKQEDPIWHELDEDEKWVERSLSTNAEIQ